MSGVNISPSYIVNDRLQNRFALLSSDNLQDLMKIGDGTTGKITSPEKEGGLVAIYYLGTLVGALGYGSGHRII